jgi:hypothetical protein
MMLAYSCSFVDNTHRRDPYRIQGVTWQAHRGAPRRGSLGDTRDVWSQAQGPAVFTVVLITAH